VADKADKVDQVDEVAIASALRALLDAGGDVDVDILSGARAVFDAPMHPQERVLVHGVVDRVRRQTATGRLLLREVLRTMGVAPGPILRTTGGRPALPIGIVASLAHDDDVAVCVAALVPRTGVNLALGVDVEPALPLPAEILDDVVISPGDRAAVSADGVVDPVRARLLFCVKEAVYKACFPLDGVFLEFADVAVVEGTLPGRVEATTRTGWRVTVTTTSKPVLLACARVRLGQPAASFP
jgi:4'-phosphopantetheinyl transferase EntD